MKNKSSVPSRIEWIQWYEWALMIFCLIFTFTMVILSISTLISDENLFIIITSFFSSIAALILFPRKIKKDRFNNINEITKAIMEFGRDNENSIDGILLGYEEIFCTVDGFYNKSNLKKYWKKFAKLSEFIDGQNYKIEKDVIVFEDSSMADLRIDAFFEDLNKNKIQFYLITRYHGNPKYFEIHLTNHPKGKKSLNIRYKGYNLRSNAAVKEFNEINRVVHL